LVPRGWSVEHELPLLEHGSPEFGAVSALPEEVVVAFDVVAAVHAVPESLVALTPEEVVHWENAPPYTDSHVECSRSDELAEVARVVLELCRAWCVDEHMSLEWVRLGWFFRVCERCVQCLRRDPRKPVRLEWR